MEEENEEIAKRRAILSRFLASNPERLADLSRRASYKLGHPARGVNDWCDCLHSAVRTTLRRQDPKASLRPSEYPDPPIQCDEDVFPILEKHLRRKLNTARRGIQNDKNLALREADIGSDDPHSTWVDMFVQRADDTGLGDDEEALLDAYIRAVITVADDFIPDDETRQVVQLRIMKYTHGEIASELGYKHSRVRRLLDEFKLLLESRLQEG